MSRIMIREVLVYWSCPCRRIFGIAIPSHRPTAYKAPMKVPKRLKPLVEDGLVDEVLSQLMSGKEAQVYVVRCGAAISCAKVYKEANKRGFKQAVQYREGRKVRNSRQARAMGKRSRYGQKETEEAWVSAEVDALYTLAAAGVRVPEPYGFVDGVLLMELVTDADGNAAPRLNDLVLTSTQARDYHTRIIAEVVRMLCAGLVHGDLSPFNVLVDSEGPVIIDLPQAVNAAGNNSAGMMLERDVDNMAVYFGHFAAELLKTDYGKEIWGLYESGNLQPDTPLTGQFKRSTVAANVAEVMQIIDDAREQELERRQRELAAREST